MPGISAAHLGAAPAALQGFADRPRTQQGECAQGSGDVEADPVLNSFLLLLFSRMRNRWVDVGKAAGNLGVKVWTGTWVAREIEDIREEKNIYQLYKISEETGGEKTKQENNDSLLNQHAN